MVTFESLPVELIADILGELDLETLIKLSYLSKRLHSIAADPSLNPWRRPILRNLRSDVYEPCMKHLSVRSTVPRRNWLEILSLARADFILFEATLPNLRTSDWEECFKRRALFVTTESLGSILLALQTISTELEERKGELEGNICNVRSRSRRQLLVGT
jgi:hypothetical protein